MLELGGGYKTKIQGIHQDIQTWNRTKMKWLGLKKEATIKPTPSPAQVA